MFASNDLDHVDGTNQVERRTLWTLAHGRIPQCSDPRIALAIAVTAKALDRLRSEDERNELRIEALLILSHIATD